MDHGGARLFPITGHACRWVFDDAPEKKLGLSLVCAELKIPFHIVSDSAIDAHLRQRLEDLGGSVNMVSKKGVSANPQVLRMQALQKHRDHHPGTF